VAFVVIGVIVVNEIFKAIPLYLLAIGAAMASYIYDRAKESEFYFKLNKG
jgi:hypothetical protein